MRSHYPGMMYGGTLFLPSSAARERVRLIARRCNAIPLSPLHMLHLFSSQGRTVTRIAQRKTNKTATSRRHKAV